MSLLNIKYGKDRRDSRLGNTFGDEQVLFSLVSCSSRTFTMLQAFFVSISTIFIAEIGDKTQLLALMLGVKFSRNKLYVSLGILLAMLVNHAICALLGGWLQSNLTINLTNYIFSLSFILLGFWMLCSQDDKDITVSYLSSNAFGCSFLLFLLAELGDKTQVVTILLATKFDSLISVIVGSTLGIMLANIPIVFLGDYLIKKINFKLIKPIFSILFILSGIVMLLISFNLI